LSYKNTAGLRNHWVAVGLRSRSNNRVAAELKLRSNNRVVTESRLRSNNGIAVELSAKLSEIAAGSEW
jgi:hypothetical protein